MRVSFFVTEKDNDDFPFLNPFSNVFISASAFPSSHEKGVPFPLSRSGEGKHASLLPKSGEAPNLICLTSFVVVAFEDCVSSDEWPGFD